MHLFLSLDCEVNIHGLAHNGGVVTSERPINFETEPVTRVRCAHSVSTAVKIYVLLLSKSVVLAHEFTWSSNCAPRWKVWKVHGHRTTSSICTIVNIVRDGHSPVPDCDGKRDFVARSVRPADGTFTTRGTTVWCVKRHG